MITPAQLQFWQKHGYLHLTDLLSPEDREMLPRWTADLADLPETPGQWMKYFERAEGRRQLCRVENFLQYHAGFSTMLRNSRTLDAVSRLMGEPATLYKEKINYKLPGGKGFTPHQDAPAFTTFGQTYHITMMIAVDAATVENGCLDVVPGRHLEGLLEQAPDGTLSKQVIESLPWEPVTMRPGDVLFFGSYLPHGSGPNRSRDPRRALYVTYSRKSEGEFRDEYFAHKRKHFPPECERVAGVDYSQAAGVYNLGNPID